MKDMNILNSDIDKKRWVLGCLPWAIIFFVLLALSKCANGETFIGMPESFAPSDSILAEAPHQFPVFVGQSISVPEGKIGELGMFHIMGTLTEEFPTMIFTTNLAGLQAECITDSTVFTLVATSDSTYEFQDTGIPYHRNHILYSAALYSSYVHLIDLTGNEFDYPIENVKLFFIEEGIK